MNRTINQGCIKLNGTTYSHFVLNNHNGEQVKIEVLNQEKIKVILANGMECVAKAVKEISTW